MTSVLTPLDASSVVFVHGHPDDETLTTGGLLSVLAERGRKIAVLTATRGEGGEVVPGPFKALEGTPALLSRRQAELAAALTRLGPGIGHAFLGEGSARAPGLAERVYQDSGMVWADDGLAAPAPGAARDSLTKALAAEIDADIAAYLTSVGADCVVSYGPLGGYRHPDHVAIGEATSRAARSLDITRWSVISQDEKDLVSLRNMPRLEVDATATESRIVAALECYGTQLTVLGATNSKIRIRHSGGQEDAVFLRELYRAWPLNSAE